MSKRTSICRGVHSLLNIELSSDVCCCRVVDFDQYLMFYPLKPLCMLSTSLEPCCQAGDKISINIMNWHFFFRVFQTVEVSTRAGGLQRWLITWSRNVCVGSRPCTSRVSHFHSASLCVRIDLVTFFSPCGSEARRGSVLLLFQILILHPGPQRSNVTQCRRAYLALCWQPPAKRGVFASC